MKVAFQITFQTIPVCFFFLSAFCLPLPFSPIYAFFLFSRPLARLVISGGQNIQNVSLLVSLQNFPAIVLNTLEAPLIDFFFVFLYFFFVFLCIS